MIPIQNPPHARAIALEMAPAASAGWSPGATLLLLGPGLIWGASFLFIAEGLDAIGPFGLAFFRILVGCATLGLLPASRRPVPRGDRPAIALLGALWFALPLTLYPLAEQRVASALAGMMNGAIPLLTALLGAALARRAPSRGELGGLGVGLAGSLLVAGPALGAGGSGALGPLLIFVAMACLAASLHLARPLQRRSGVLPVVWRAQAAALVLSAPLGLPQFAAARWSPGPLLALLALGALGTGIAYVLLASAAARFGATRAAAVNFVIPGVALVLGVAVRGERVALISIAGAALCAAGARLLHRAIRN